MNLSLISNITKWNGYYLIISGISSEKKLTILHKNLEVINEFTFEDTDIWDINLHIDEVSLPIIISVTTSGTFELIGTDACLY